MLCGLLQLLRLCHDKGACSLVCTNKPITEKEGEYRAPEAALQTETRLLHTPHCATNAHAASRCRVVLARYSENYSWIEQLVRRGIPHVVYNKNIKQLNRPRSQFYLPGLCERPFGNYATEELAYLYDMVANARQTTAHWTIFGQAGLECDSLGQPAQSQAVH